MNTLDLLGKRVSYKGEVGLVVGRCDPLLAGRDKLASQRGRSVTIRIDGALGPHFVEVSEADLETIEVVGQ